MHIVQLNKNKIIIINKNIKNSDYLCRRGVTINRLSRGVQDSFHEVVQVLFCNQVRGKSMFILLLLMFAI